MKLTTRILAAPFASFILVTGFTVVASTTGFVTPDFRGTAGATFDGWEKFTVASGAPGNLGDLAGSSGIGNFTQTDPAAFITGTGNIYNQTGVSAYQVTYTTANPVDHVVFQARTAGTELDYSSIRLTFAGGSLTATRTETDRLSFGGPPGTPGSGFAVSSLWDFNLTGLNASSFQINFKAADVSVSFDSAMLDVKAAPEPGLMALGTLGLGLAAFLNWRRR